MSQDHPLSHCKECGSPRPDIHADFCSKYQHGPSTRQVGGDHYKDMAIQPSEFIYKNGLNWLQGNAIKYVVRHARKGGAQDLEKAKHYIDLLMEWEYEQE